MIREASSRLAQLPAYGGPGIEYVGNFMIAQHEKYFALQEIGDSESQRPT